MFLQIPTHTHQIPEIPNDKCICDETSRLPVHRLQVGQVGTEPHYPIYLQHPIHLTPEKYTVRLKNHPSSDDRSVLTESSDDEAVLPAVPDAQQVTQ